MASFYRKVFKTEGRTSRRRADGAATRWTTQEQNSQRGQALARLGVPELDGLLAVLAARHHQAFGRVPVHTLDVGPVTWEGSHRSDLGGGGSGLKSRLGKRATIKTNVRLRG